MTGIRTQTPEVLYGDTAAKASAYDKLARDFAASGNSLAAIHAAWAADMHTVQEVVWERLMVASPNPEQQFFSVAHTVSKTLVEYVRTAEAVEDARAVVLHARSGLSAAFDMPLRKLVEAKYPNLDYLADLPVPDADALAANASARLDGKSIDEVIEARKQVAADCMSVAASMYQEGRLNDAIQQAYQSDLVMFESYLLESAKAVGDTSLVLVDLRWGLACAAIARIPGLPTDFMGAIEAIRRALLTAVNPVEVARLREVFIAPAM